MISNPTIGAITFIGSITNWDINVSTGLSKPVLSASPGAASMDLNSVDHSTGAGTLNIFISDTGFPGGLPYGGTLSGGVGGTTDSGSLSFGIWKSLSNTLFGTDGPTVLLGPFSPLAFSGSGSTPHGPLPALYAMTLGAHLVHSRPGTTSFDLSGHNVSVPEPSSMAFAGLGVLGLVGYGIRRRRGV